MAEHVAVVRKKGDNFQIVGHSRGPGHISTFNEADILVNDDSLMSREMLESWFSGPQSINKRNDLRFPYCVLRHCLSQSISRVERAGPSNNSEDSEHICRAVIKPASDTDNEIAAINESKAKCQAATALIKTPSGETLLLDLNVIQNMLKFCGKVFPTVGYAYNIVPTYTSGHIGYVIASKKPVSILTYSFCRLLFHFVNQRGLVRLCFR
ncbi:unnamed protein product [Dibothriocephalus latus]|uniref:Uncharacterized protein n=1 Tax=Dibothriocephalus latus TaxID=60516 RepID=A0A3P7M0V4_DIBLA|nr:unnamed protein product [Dibothriocephalus latus]